MVPVTADMFIAEASKTDDILNVCHAIFIYRLQRDYTQEEYYYFRLIDIFRSPTMIKKLCASSIKPLKAIKKEDENLDCIAEVSEDEEKDEKEEKGEKVDDQDDEEEEKVDEKEEKVDEQDEKEDEVPRYEMIKPEDEQAEEGDKED